MYMKLQHRQFMDEEFTEKLETFTLTFIRILKSLIERLHNTLPELGNKNDDYTTLSTLQEETTAVSAGLRESIMKLPFEGRKMSLRDVISEFKANKSEFRKNLVKFAVHIFLSSEMQYMQASVYNSPEIALKLLALYVATKFLKHTISDDITDSEYVLEEKFLHSKLEKVVGVDFKSFGKLVNYKLASFSRLGDWRIEQIDESLNMRNLNPPDSDSDSDLNPAELHYSYIINYRYFLNSLYEIVNMTSYKEQDHPSIDELKLQVQNLEDNVKEMVSDRHPIDEKKIQVDELEVSSKGMLSQLIFNIFQTIRMKIETGSISPKCSNNIFYDSIIVLTISLCILICFLIFDLLIKIIFLIFLLTIIFYSIYECLDMLDFVHNIKSVENIMQKIRSRIVKLTQVKT